MWLKGLVGEIFHKMSLVDVHCDCENAIHLARNQNTFHGRTKHIDVRYNFVMTRVKGSKGIINISHLISLNVLLVRIDVIFLVVSWGLDYI